jgi:hypothetical protein
MKILGLDVWVLSLGFVLAGCATSFTGSAHIEGGRGACQSKCAGQGMQMAGMVYMGEYSSACVCEVPGANVDVAAVAAPTAGVAGVEMQRQQQEQQRQQQQLVAQRP